MKRVIISLMAVFLVIAFQSKAICEVPKDTLVVGVPSDIHTLDPAVSSDNYDWRQIY